MHNELQAVLDLTKALGESFETLYQNRTLEQLSATKQAALQLKAAIEEAEPYWSGFMPIYLAVRMADWDYRQVLRLNDSTLKVLEMIEDGEFFNDWQSEEDPAGLKFNADAFINAAKLRQEAFDDTVKNGWM